MQKATYHHTSLTRGYVSTKEENGIVKDYNGRFGTGYTVRKHNPQSTYYCFIEYHIYA